MQSYYGGGELDVFHRAPHRPMGAAYYDRPAPYAIYEQPHPDFKSEYVSRRNTRTSIQEPDPEHVTAGGQPRRRITVACSRCRRRKIKCSGDPGNGSGCSACRQSGTDVSACNFIRVNSTAVDVLGIDSHAQASSAGASSQSQSWPGATWEDTIDQQRAHSHQQPHARPSLPTLHTRSSFFDNYEQYENSPVETYTYGSTTFPRQDSFASTYLPLENYRSWSTAGTLAAPVTASYYEQQNPACNFGTLHAPAYHQAATNRLPSVTSDSFSSLNMGSLHSSLPTQTVQERRLPIPIPNSYTPTPQHQPTPFISAEVPEIRPLVSFGSEPRVHINGIHSRNAMPWSTSTSMAEGPTAPISTMCTANGLPRMPALQHDLSVPDSGFGYQISMTTTLPASMATPETSPTAGPTPPEPFSDHGLGSYPAITKRPRVANFHYITNHDNLADSHPLPSISTLDDLPVTSSSSSRDAPLASLYSFSTDTGDGRPSTSSGESTAASATEPFGHGHTYAPSLRHSQPHHAASVEALRRQSSSDQHQRSQTTQRMSVSNLSTRY